MEMIALKLALDYLLQVLCEQKENKKRAMMSAEVE